MNASQCRFALKFPTPREAFQAGRTPDEGSHLIADERKFRSPRREARGHCGRALPCAADVAASWRAIIHPPDRALLVGRTASEIMDAVVEAVGPADGTQDAEASRKAIRGCLSEILERYPDANLLDPYAPRGTDQAGILLS
jgi:hypothetical protein